MNQTVVGAGGRLVGGNNPVFIIAEAGVNHNGSLDIALELIDVAAEAGAHAVKFQAFNSTLLVSEHAPKCEYQKETTDPSESQIDMLRALEFADPLLAFKKLKEHCVERGILFMCTPFDNESVDLLEKVSTDVYKIASADCISHQLLRRVARTGKPIILSTGMATMEEVRGGVAAIQGAEGFGGDLMLMHCVSCYPTNPEDCNLNAMKTMRSEFGVPVGFSDHTLGLEVPIAAVAAGAELYEKHYTLSRSMRGPDHRASLEPRELQDMTASIRRVQKMLGTGVKEPRPSEENTRLISRRSLVTRCALAKGTVLADEHLRPMRPATGILPCHEDQVWGRHLTRDVPAGHILVPNDITPGGP